MYRVPENRTGRSLNDYQTPASLRQALTALNTPVAAAPINNSSNDSPRLIDQASIQSVSATMDLDPNEDWIVDGYDKETSQPPLLELEHQRLAVLKSYRVVGTGRNVTCDRLVSLACRIFKTPIALASVIDLGCQYVLASRGLGEFAEGPRKTSLCAHAIISKSDMIVVPDLKLDDRFKNSKHVTGSLGLRFYAAAPLVSPEGFRLGALCIMDKKPRQEMSLEDKQNLREIADMIVDALVEHRDMKNHEYRNPSQVIACTSNDLLAPLRAVVKGLSSIGDDEKLLDSLGKQQREVFNTAVTCSSVMNRLCRESLGALLSERTSLHGICKQGMLEDGKPLLNIQELVKQLHVVMEPFPKQVPLIITTDPGVPSVVIANDLILFRSAVNFLTNACSKTETGSVHLTISVESNVSSEESGQGSPQKNLLFTVEDSGPGVSVSKYRYLFKPMPLSRMTQGSACTSGVATPAGVPSVSMGADGSETGMGLYSVATQIGSVGGKYGYRTRETNAETTGSSVISGSIFWFSIPLQVPDPAVVEESTNTSPIAKTRLPQSDYQRTAESVQHLVDIDLKRSRDELVQLPPGKRRRRALIIEDSLSFRKDISKKLSKLGFEVVQAVNGMEGLKVMQSTTFDLVLCDLLMPIMEGMDCVEQYRSFEAAHRPWFNQFIVGISAHASASTIERGLKLGMNGFHAKPITDDVLQGILESQEFKDNVARLDEMDAEASRNETRPRKQHKKETPPVEAQSIVCLIAEEGNAVAQLAEKEGGSMGCKAVVVHDGETALRLLKMRNWDAVLLDDLIQGLSSSRCVANFREWEKKNRVKRQKNIVQLSSSFIPTKLQDSSSVQLPSGFDAALGKPVSPKMLRELLGEVSKGTLCTSEDILSR